MDYQQSRAYIRDAEQYAGGALDLTNIKEIMKRLGNPQDQLKYVHVAGTNGKGSVIAYLYTTLTNAGYHVGRYISPSVYSYREKIEVEGKPISREQFAKHTTRVAAVIEEMTAVSRIPPHLKSKRRWHFYFLQKKNVIRSSWKSAWAASQMRQT